VTVGVPGRAPGNDSAERTVGHRMRWPLRQWQREQPPDAGSPGPGGEPRATPGWSRARIAALVVVLCGLAWSSLWRHAVPTVATDEPTYVKAGWQYVHGTFGLNLEHPPLAKYLFGIAQLIFGQGVPSARIAAGLCSMLTGVFIMLLARGIAGFWAGIVAAAMWIALPLPSGFMSGALTFRLDRFAMLDGVMLTFATAALYVGWLWLRSGRWVFAVAAGGVLGLAAAAKLPALAMLPVIVVAGLVSLRSWRALWQGIALSGTAAVAFAATYLPFGRSAPHALRYMWQFQSEHDQDGHAIYIFGHVYTHAPWWTIVGYQWVANGPVVNIALLLACLAAVVLRRDKGVAYLVAAGLVTVVGFMLSAVVLPHYVYAYEPALLTLAAVGIAELWRRRITAVVSVALAAALAVPGAIWIGHLATLKPTDYAELPRLLRGSDHPVIVLMGAGSTLLHHFPAARVVYAYPQDATPVAAVVLDPAYTVRFGDANLADAARRHGMRQTTAGRLRVWLPPAA
jgi:4-amino-4-deoxy-L-arabinose transferase-like glycosyltransferase